MNPRLPHVLLLCLLPFGANAEALLDATRNDDPVAAIRLLDRGARVELARSADGTTALHWAAHHGELQLALRLIKSGAAVNARNDFGATPLQEAAVKGDAAMIAALLAAGANANTTNDDGETVLMSVARTGNVEAADLLIKAGANVNAVESWRGQTALMWASSQRSPQMVKLLLQAGADANAVSALRNWARTTTAEPRPQWRPPGGFTALQLAAREGCAGCALELVKGGAKLDAASPDGITALLFAVLNARFDTAKVLIAAGADVNLADKWGRAPLYSAIDYNTTPRGGRPDRPSSDVTTPLEIAAMLLDHKANIDFALKAFPPYRLLGPDRGGDVLLTTGATALTRAAKACDVPAAKLLLSRGANVNAATSQGLTPLLVAAGSGWAITDTRGRFRDEKQCIEMARMLLDAGANINAANAAGQSSLHAAARLDMKEFVLYLGGRGADPTIKDRSGFTALDIAEGRTGTAARPGASGPEKHPEVAAVLQELMRKR
jgi:ankyrin repeat protein